ncbi:hypothetical protein F5Y01DRAFT_318507 [Xylaria sp. FL0043]|nr:hypothetical protein F5Y01DRAFT_318507 [Xylaria sp. FL0043]
MRHYVPTNLKWLEYQLSRFVPGQFDKYGYTFWIPSQLEPTVALIGTSLPAIQPLFQTSSGSLVDMLVSRLKLRSLVESFTSGGKSSITNSRPLPSGDFMVMDENNSNMSLTLEMSRIAKSSEEHCAWFYIARGSYYMEWNRPD